LGYGDRRDAAIELIYQLGGDASIVGGRKGLKLLL